MFIPLRPSKLKPDSINMPSGRYTAGRRDSNPGQSALCPDKNRFPRICARFLWKSDGAFIEYATWIRGSWDGYSQNWWLKCFWLGVRSRKTFHVITLKSTIRTFCSVAYLSTLLWIGEMKRRRERELLEYFGISEVFYYYYFKENASPRLDSAISTENNANSDGWAI